MRERNGKTLTYICDAEHESLPEVVRRAEPGSHVYADEATCWDGLHATFETDRINPSR